MPEEFLSLAHEEDLESYVASVTGGPEEFLAKVLLEDVSKSVAL